jgi:SAM-dependent methyltransferase
VTQRANSVHAPSTRGDVAPNTRVDVDVIGRMHRQCIGTFIGLLPRNAAVLDAACGTGKYWDILIAAGCEVMGIDASAQSLATAQQRFPDVPTQQCELQSLPFDSTFDGVLCIDALHLVPTHELPGAFENLHRALRPGGHAYLTFALSPRAPDGSPEVRHVPKISTARGWIDDAGFRVVEELQGDGYAHLIATRRL